MAAHQAPPSLGFSRQEHWSGLPFPSPMHESDKWKWSCSAAPNSRQVLVLSMTKVLQQYVNCELPDVQAGFREGRGTRDQIANIRWIIEKQESSRKTSISALLIMPKPLTVWITINCGKFFKRWEYQTTLPASWEICMQIKKQQLEAYIEHWLVQNWKRSITRLCAVTLFI